MSILSDLQVVITPFLFGHIAEHVTKFTAANTFEQRLKSELFLENCHKSSIFNSDLISLDSLDSLDQHQLAFIDQLIAF